MSCWAACTIFCLASDRCPITRTFLPVFQLCMMAYILSELEFPAKETQASSTRTASERILMPFVNIALARGKPGEYLEAVSGAVHDALVAELHMKPEDEFQLIHQHEPGEMVFNRNFRGGPRSDDWIVFTITDGLDRGERAKRKFYKTLVRLLEEGPGVRPADVFVMMTVTPPENFSFADGVLVTDVAGPLAFAAATPAPRDAYTQAEMAAAVTELFKNRARPPILPMLRDDVV